MVSQRDLLMYLVSIKSIYTKISEGTICIINDGSLTSKAKDILQYHLGSPTIVDIRLGLPKIDYPGSCANTSTIVSTWSQ